MIIIININNLYKFGCSGQLHDKPSPLCIIHILKFYYFLKIYVDERVEFARFGV